ncbi:MAG: hypothetical protein WD016_12890 [Balneolaceae bacterium]
MYQENKILNATTSKMRWELLVKIIISIIAYFSFILLFTAEPVFAQQSERQIVPLDEDNYECLQQLKCVVESVELRDKGWVVTFDETIENYPQKRTARMKGDAINVTAHYDKEGSLIKGSYKQHNAALPRELLAHLAEGDYSGWTMTKNTVLVQDFNAASTVYKIILESENEAGKKTLRFTHSDIMEMKERNTKEIAENQ